MVMATARYARTKVGRTATVTYNGERYDAPRGERLTTITGVITTGGEDHLMIIVNDIRRGIHVSRVREVVLHDQEERA